MDFVKGSSTNVGAMGHSYPIRALAADDGLKGVLQGD